MLKLVYCVLMTGTWKSGTRYELKFNATNPSQAASSSASFPTARRGTLGRAPQPVAPIGHDEVLSTIL